MPHNPNTVKSQDDLNKCNDGKQSSDVLLATIDELEKVKKENERLVDILMGISYCTPALGGTKKDMEKALLDIDWLCNWALRPDEMREMEKNNGI